jgi:hypothetical protein
LFDGISARTVAQLLFYLNDNLSPRLWFGYRNAVACVVDVLARRGYAGTWASSPPSALLMLRAHLSAQDLFVRFLKESTWTAR